MMGVSESWFCAIDSAAALVLPNEIRSKGNLTKSRASLFENFCAEIQG